MTGRVLPLGVDPHRQVQALLPWYLGTGLDAEERAEVEAHLAGCADCRAELAWERELQAACALLPAGTPGDVDRDFAQWRARLGSAPTAPAAARRDLGARLAQRWRASPPWTRWALAGQCVLVASLGTALGASLWMQPATEARFRALGEPSAAAERGNLIVRFRADATEEQMRHALRDSQARLVYGPTSTDAYLLAVPAGSEAAAVRRLRQQASVLLAESLVDRAAP